MARRAEEHLLEVELVEDDDASAGPPAPAERSTSATGPRRRRGWFLAVAVAATGAVAVAVMQEPQAPAPGARGVLEAPVDEVWRTAGTVVHGDADGIVALGGDIFSRAFVGAVESATGAVRWEEPLGRDGPADRCGAGAVTTDPPTLWCVRSRTAEERGRGAVHGRLVGLDLRSGAPVVAQGTSDPVTLDEPSLGYAAVGPDLVLADRDEATVSVRRVRPADGAAVWSVAFEVAPEDVGRRDGTVRVVDGLVLLSGATSAVIDAVDGQVLGEWRARTNGPWRPDGAVVVPAAHGFAAWPAQEGRPGQVGVWHGLDGEPITEFAGDVAEPESSDGSVPDVLLTRRSGTVLVALDVRSGTDLWSARLDAGRVLTRSAGAVVVSDGAVLRSTELTSGRVRWEVAVPGLQPGAGFVADDRTVVVMAVQADRWVLVSLDVATGERLWVAEADGTPVVASRAVVALPPRLGWVAGHPTVRSARTLTWLG